MMPLTLALAVALAQEYPAGAVLSVEIVGTAPLPGLGIDRALLPYPVQTAGGSQLGQGGGSNLAEFMARTLNGVNVNEVSGSPFQNDITYRGYRASPVLGSAQGISVYLDGVRVNEPFGDVVNWDMIPEAAIGKLLLVPGANPLFGLNTLGGALALTTKSGRSHPGAQAEVSTGSDGRRRADLALGVKGENGWHAFAAATTFHDRGWRAESAGRVENALFKLGRAGRDTDWQLTVLGGRSLLRGNGLLPDGLYQDDRRAAYTFPDQTRNRLLQAVFNVEHRIGAQTELTAAAYTRHSRRDSVNGDVSEEPDESAHAGVLNASRTRQRGQGGSANLSAVSGGHRVDAGTSVDQSSTAFAQFEQAATISAARAVLADPAAGVEPASSVTGSARAWSVYAADTWTIVRGISVTASARYNHARVANTLTTTRGPQAPETFSYRRLNPALGVAYVAAPGLTLFANAAQGNRVPTVIELGCADPAQPCQLPVGLQSDPYLKQVVAHTIEAGVRWQRGASVSFYRTRNRDDILFLSAGAARRGYFANFEKTRHQGADLDWHASTGPLVLRVGYSYLEAVYDAAGELFTGERSVEVVRGTRLAGLPRHTLKLGMEWTVLPSLTVAADAQAMSRLPAQGGEDGFESAHGHALLNLRATWQPAARWEWSVRINNAMDRRYESYAAMATDMFPNGRLASSREGADTARFVAPGAPRSITANLRYTF
jgi:outer membrane receptor protein involved in Fe transport